MSTTQSVNGDSLEYSVYSAIRVFFGTCTITEKIAVDLSKKRTAFDSQDFDVRTSMTQLSMRLLERLVELEPALCQVKLRAGGITLHWNGTNAGKAGDPRDLIIQIGEGSERKDVGISCKNNSDEIKGPRLNVDRATDGLSISPVCYPNSVLPTETLLNSRRIFENVTLLKNNPSYRAWGDVPHNNKKEIYHQIIEFIETEFIENRIEPALFLKFALGTYDYYIFKRESEYHGRITAINPYGTLGDSSAKSSEKIFKCDFDRALVFSKSYEGVTGAQTPANTLQLAFEGGWWLKMRIKNGDSSIKLSSLKFMISLIGTPYELYQDRFSIKSL